MATQLPPQYDPERLALHRLRSLGEAILLILVTVSPWLFASVDPPAEFALCSGVALLAALWAAHAALAGRITVRLDCVAIALGGFAAWSAFQLLPLPAAFVGVISPQRVDWHRTLLPDTEELLPGESNPVTRSAFLTLTIDPSATWTFLCRSAALLVVYLAARNWLATRHSFARLAWVLVGNGVALSAFALVQAVSSAKGVIFWAVQLPGGAAPFGPFICRNHFPDYVALCLGLCLGLLLPRHRTPWEGRGAKLMTGRTLGLTAALALMAVSVPFSLSRGGTLAALVAGAGCLAMARSAGRHVGAGAWALLAAAGGAAAAAAWLGTGAVGDRLATLGTEEAAISRLPLWADSLRLVPGVWGGGTGGGTFVWAEPTARSDGRSATVYYENAHNEYLEALVEGGVVRGVLALVLAVAPVVVLARAYRRLHDRSVGPWLLGATFGLAAVALHAVTDFGLHTPAVALLTAVVAGFALAAAQEPGFAPQRVRVRHDQARPPNGIGGVAEPAKPPATAPGHRGSARGGSAVLAGLAVAGLASVAAWDARSRDQSYRLLLAADAAAAGGRPADRVRLLDARAAARPTDPDTLFAAALAHLDEAVAESWAPGAAVAGGAVGFAAGPDRVTPVAAGRHLGPALAALRAARRANPLAPKPHARLGDYAQDFLKSEAAVVHFARAKSLLPADPEVWFASGRSAVKRGDPNAAWADWKQSLTISPEGLPRVLAAARGRLSPDQIRTALLPDDPVTVWWAAELLFPDRVAQAAERRPFVDRVVGLARSPGSAPPDPDRLMAAAAALDELGRIDDSDATWLQAVQLAPGRADVRNRYARWLESEERYAEALPHLEWLRRNNLNNLDIKGRLAAARHALELNRMVEGKE